MALSKHEFNDLFTPKLPKVLQDKSTSQLPGLTWKFFRIWPLDQNQPWVVTVYTHIPHLHGLSSFHLSGLLADSSLHQPVWNPVKVYSFFSLCGYIISLGSSSAPPSLGLSFLSFTPGRCFTLVITSQHLCCLLFSLIYCRVHLFLPAVFPGHSIVGGPLQVSINVCWMGDDEWLMGKFYCF